MLIGRDAERQALARLAVAARVSESGALLVVGEAGQGKTALLEELATRAEGLRVLRARGSESESDLAFGGLDQLVRPLLPLLGEIPEPQALALETALALRPGDRADRFAISAATLSLLGRAAEEQPVLVLVDDAHALDRPSAEALVFVARRILADPLAVVAASRPTGGVLLEAGLPRIDLEGLSPAEVTALLTQRSGHPLPDDVAARVHEATAGNPLAVVELAASAPDLLDRLTPATPIGVPDRVVAEYVRRTAALGPSARTALLVASVASTASVAEGSAVAAAAVDRLGVGWDELREAEAAGLVALRPGRVEFRHPLARAGAYAAASAEQRREAHLAVAAVTDDPDRRAWHRGEGTLGLDDRVADEVAAAARRSLDRGAYWVAASSYERSAALATDREQRGERMLAAGEAAALAGHGSRATALLDLAAAETANPQRRGRVDALRGAVEQRWGSLERSRELIRRALEALAPVDPDAAVDAATDLVATCFYLGDTALAAHTADTLDELADRASEAARVRCLLAGGVARVIAGEDGIAAIRAAVAAMAGATPATDDLRPSWLVLGPLFLREESATARGLAELAERQLRDRAAIGSLAGLLFVVARYAGSTDRWADAARHYQEGIALAREAGQTTDLAMLLAGLAWLEARTGPEQPCREHAAEALALAARHRVHLARIWATYALGDLELGAGRHAEALERYAELQAFLDRIGFRDVDISPEPELVECLHRTHRPDEAARLAGDYRSRARAKGQPWALARAERVSALVADDPRPGLERALALHAASPDRFEEARTRLVLGEVERRSRRRTASREPLRAALASFESLGARPWADRAAVELEATGERPHRRADRSIDLLTPQELQVATLLAEGRTTRQAAAAMFLSPKTVEYHLRHAYTKLGINTRADLARALAGEPGPRLSTE
ncbi:helix-turn-helix transcriptional regulator [Nocardioides sp. W7]|uniref:ATP-binding protein n=1 Tax=Nocardioides sp. W7 TaxID=2931390 RepID=UPI001FD35213|nr:helix-turn-helix transcriptional regulator [Nocardioides sp. W7]